MKHKIPPEHFVDPNDDRPMRFDPATGTKDAIEKLEVPELRKKYEDEQKL